MEKQQCRGIIVSLLCLVLLLCSGCRMRVVEGPEADLFLPLDGYTETESEISPTFMVVVASFSAAHSILTFVWYSLKP